MELRFKSQGFSFTPKHCAIWSQIFQFELNVCHGGSLISVNKESDDTHLEHPKIFESWFLHE